MAQEMVSVPPSQLRDFAAALLHAEGLDARSSALVADHLVEANLTGHDSHGIGMLPQYVADIRKGGATKDSSAAPKLLRQEGPLLVVDAERKFGQVVLADVLASAEPVAREHGVCLVCVRNAHHVGRLGAYSEQCASRGLVSLLFANVNAHPPLVAPFCGADARSSTNPISLSVPRRAGGGGGEASRVAEHDIVLDFATSAWPLGKARVAWNRNEPAPPGVLLDPEGRPTRDASVMFPNLVRGGAYVSTAKMGALRPMGQHKGAGLNLFCEFFGALAGGGTSASTSPNNKEECRDNCTVNNVFGIVIHPSKLCAPEFDQEVRVMADYWAASPAAPLPDGGPSAAWGRVLLPGEAEKIRARQRADAIPIEASTWAALERLAEDHASVALPARMKGAVEKTSPLLGPNEAPRGGKAALLAQALLGGAALSLFAAGFAVGRRAAS